LEGRAVDTRRPPYSGLFPGSPPGYLAARCRLEEEAFDVADHGAWGCFEGQTQDAPAPVVWANKCLTRSESAACLSGL